MRRCKRSEPLYPKGQGGRRPSLAECRSGLPREPILGKFFRVSDCRFFGIEIAQSPVRRLWVKSDFCENDLGGEFAVVGGTWRAIGIIAAQCKDSLHWVGNSQDAQIVARSARVLSWSSDHP